jgi:hypothetical protein
MKFSIIIVGLAIVFASPFCWAQKRHRSSPPSNPYLFTYDLGASFGNYNNSSYTEITLGLNWYLREFLIWRNAVFTRFGSMIDSVTGLDSSVRFVFDTRTQGSGLGLTLFAGPGYRFANANNSAYFAEAGGVLHAGGLSLGGGVKNLYYTNPGVDKNGAELPKTDQIIFIILAGGGAF